MKHNYSSVHSPLSPSFKSCMISRIEMLESKGESISVEDYGANWVLFTRQLD